MLILYVSINMLTTVKNSIIFLENFGLEWEMRLDTKVRGNTYLGILMTRGGLRAPDTS